MARFVPVAVVAPSCRRLYCNPTDVRAVTLDRSMSVPVAPTSTVYSATFVRLLIRWPFLLTPSGPSFRRCSASSSALEKSKPPVARTDSHEEGRQLLLRLFMLCVVDSVLRIANPSPGRERIGSQPACAVRYPSPQRPACHTALPGRSEERRVGKEGRSRWSPYH